MWSLPLIAAQCSTEQPSLSALVGHMNLRELAFGLYAVLIPHKLFKILVAAYRENRLWEDEDFLESHGWLVLKYKPKR